jgi:lysophospholipase L1-like esterase
LANYKPLGVPFDRTFRNDLNANFMTIDAVAAAADLKATKAEADSAKAVADSSSAVVKANEANAKSDDTLQQLNNIVINNGESDAEVLQARGTYPVLNERLSVADKKDKKNKIEHYNVPETLKKLYRNEPITIVVAGDSLTLGSGAGWPSLDWESLVDAAIRKKFPFCQLTWKSRAVGGTTSTFLKDNWGAYVADEEADLVIISHGTNDVFLLTEQERANNYKFFVDETAKLGAELLFVTNSTVSFTPAPYGNTPDVDVAKRERYAEQTREFSREYKIGLIDANQSYRKWLSERNLTTDSTLLHYDHIHPNDLLHRIIAYEVSMVFTATTDSARALDERYGGKNYGLFGKHTFRDLAHNNSNVQGYGIFDLDNQLVDWGGLWWIKEFRDRTFKKAKLHGTQAVTGSETSQNNYQENWHIIPVDKDYIELEVRDAKKVWFAMDGGSATATDFRVLVNGVETLTFAVSSASTQPIEVPFTAAGLKYFRKGTHKVRIERVGTVPSTSFVTFHGFLVKYYDKNEGEIFSNPGGFDRQYLTNLAYSTYATSIPSRQKATNVGFITPFGYTEADAGFVQLAFNQPIVTTVDFYGDTCTVGLRATTGDNYIMVYIDDQLKATVNTIGTAGTSINYQYTGLGTNRKHKLELVCPNGQVNLNNVRFSDTLS